MQKKRFIAVLTLCFVMILSVIPVYGATAKSISKVTLTQKEVSDLKAKLNSEGVQNDKQVLLIQKITNGQLIDSMNPEKLKAIPKDFFSISNVDTQKKYVFPDGSYVKVSAIEITPKNEQKLLDTISDKKIVDRLISNQKLTSFAESGKTTYDKWVQYDYLMSGGGFQCNYTTSDSIDFGMSKINTISDEMTWARLGYTADMKLAMVRQVQLGETPAEAMLRWQYIALGGSASGYYQINFCVKYTKTYFN